MAKNNITQYDATAANNTDIDSINIDEGMAASDVNNAIRSLMSHLKNVDTGSQALTALSVTGNVTVAGDIQKTSGNLTIDVAGQLIINSDSGQIVLQDDTVNWGNLQNSSGDFIIGSLGADKDIKIQGLDSSSTIDALTLDMSDAGAASFNNSITYSGDLISSTSGTSNFRAGVNAGNSIQSGGNYNTAVGDEAGTGITTGDSNSLLGYQAGDSITEGGSNVAIGSGALSSLTTNGANTIIGASAGTSLTGADNTFVGKDAGYYITSGAKNTILGKFAGNSGGLDIRTASNYVVLSDGDGNLAAYRIGNSGGRQWHLIADADNDVGFVIKNTTSANPYGIALQFTNAANNNGSQYFIVCTDSAASRFLVYNNGNVVNTNNSYGQYSDQKLKENITDATSQWNDIKSLKVRKFNFKGDDLTQIGVVAQELESAGMNGLVEENTDRDEEMKDLGTTTKSVKYSVLYMKAVKALQEAMTRIEALEADVKALKGE